MFIQNIYVYKTRLYQVNVPLRNYWPTNVKTRKAAMFEDNASINSILSTQKDPFPLILLGHATPVIL